MSDNRVTMEDRQLEREERLKAFIKDIRDDLKRKEDFLMAAFAIYNEAFKEEKHCFSDEATDGIISFMRCDLEKLFFAEIPIPIVDEVVNHVHYNMQLAFVSNLLPDDDKVYCVPFIRKLDYDNKIAYQYDIVKKTWILMEKSDEDVNQDAGTEDIVSVRSKYVNMLAQAVNEFFDSKYKSIYGDDVNAFVELSRPLVDVTDRLSGMTRLEVLWNGQSAVVPLDGNHMGIALTYDNMYVINVYYVNGMMADDGPESERVKYCYMHESFRTENLDAAVSVLKEAIELRNGTYAPVTIPLSRRNMIMIENGRYADMINELKNKMTDLEKSGPVSQEERDVADTFIQELERHVDGLYC